MLPYHQRTMMMMIAPLTRMVPKRYFCVIVRPALPAPPKPCQVLQRSFVSSSDHRRSESNKDERGSFPTTRRRSLRRTGLSSPASSEQSARQRQAYQEIRQVIHNTVNQQPVVENRKKRRGIDNRRDRKAFLNSQKHSNRLRKMVQPNVKSPVERILSVAHAQVSSSYDGPKEHTPLQHQRDVTVHTVSTDTAESPSNSPPPPLLSSYADVMDSVLSTKHFRREHTASPIPLEVASAVIDYMRREGPSDVLVELPTLREALDSTNHPHQQPSEWKSQLTQELREQKKRFMESTGWTEKQYKIMKGGITNAANLCARHALGAPAEILWLKAKEAGIDDKGFLQTLLHVAATYLPANMRKRALYGKYSGSAVLQVLGGDWTNSDAQAGEDLIDIVDEIAVCHDLRHEPTEQSLIVRSRLLIAQGKGVDAEDLLNRYSDKEALHLRSYLPILRLYLDQADFGPALRVYRKMRELSPVQLDADTYVHVIASLAQHGMFHPGASPIDGATDLSFQSASGPGLLDGLLSEMKEEILEIPTALARRLYNAFAEGFPNSGIEKLTTLAPLKVKKDRIPEDDRLVAGLVPIDPFTGRCERTGVSMRLESLSEKQIEHLRDAVLKLASDRNEQRAEYFGGHTSPQQGMDAAQNLASFYRWLDLREGEPFTVIVDGANVAYYMQNFETGRFSYHQLQFVVDSLEERGERPLVILPRKYVLDFFYVSVGPQSGTGAWKQRLTSAEKRIREELMDSGKMAVVPKGMLDDYYWILASVSKQSVSRKERDLSVSVDDKSGRWPGTRPVLVTNDRMRDHRLGMLEPMLFQRWYSNYIVNYNFPPFMGGECSYPEIGFSPADFFSREIQRNQAVDGSAVWHFPVSDQQDVYFCLSVRNVDEKSGAQSSSSSIHIAESVQ